MSHICRQPSADDQPDRQATVVPHINHRSSLPHPHPSLSPPFSPVGHRCSQGKSLTPPPPPLPRLTAAKHQPGATPGPSTKPNKPPRSPGVGPQKDNNPHTNASSNLLGGPIKCNPRKHSPRKQASSNPLEHPIKHNNPQTRIPGARNQAQNCSQTWLFEPRGGSAEHDNPPRHASFNPSRNPVKVNKKTQKH